MLRKRLFFNVLTKSALVILLGTAQSYAACLLDGATNTTSQLTNSDTASISAAAGNNWDITSCDVSGVTDMSSLFRTDSTFNQDISGWDVSNVTSMYQMFEDANAFNQDISGWDVSSVTDMKRVFKKAYAFNQNLSTWNVSSVTIMESAFEYASAFNQPLNTWNVGAVTNFDYMLKDTLVFNQSLNQWATSSATTMRGMFRNTSVFNQDISSWNTSSVTNMKWLFMNAAAFDQNIGAWDMTSVSNLRSFSTGSGLSRTNYDAMLNAWSQQTLLTGETIDIGTTQYSTLSATARASIISTYAWTINDGGLYTPSSPLAKADVVGSIEAWTNIARRNAHNTTNTITSRLDFLRRNYGHYKLSHQGINVKFADVTLDKVMNGDVATSGDLKTDMENLAAAGQNTGDLTNQASSVASDLAFDSAISMRKEILSTLNPTSSEKIGQWSMWSAGQVTLGSIDVSATAAKQAISGNSITLGMDKPISQHERIGFALTMANDDVDVGTAGSSVDADNYAMTSYGSFIYPTVTLEGIFGYGQLDLTSTRVDGIETLTGSRKGKQIFASVAVRSNQSRLSGNLSISPYARLDGSYSRLNKFTETGGANALTYNQQAITTAMFAAGLDVNYETYVYGGLLKPYAKVEFGSDFSSDSDASMYYNSATSTVYTTSIASRDDTRWKTELGTDFFFSSGVTGSFFYIREMTGSQARSNSVGLRFSGAK
ncbi:MAG TPA: hypothetical protein DE179_04500 [Oceanospirillaceae bacterium]|nr:hypothetical protein [Oceanospirillaceae bacterium]